jgi:predicted nucleic acid-binding protein
VIVLDTNVLMYAVGRERGLRDPARELLERAARGEIAVTTTPEVIQEFTHVCASSRTRENAADHALDYVDAFSPLLVTLESDLAPAIEMYQ